jgi:hypothetical protein
MIEEFEKILILIRKHDIPNWLILLFTGIVWPLILFLWNRRKFHTVHNLEVSFVDGQMQIMRNNVKCEYDAIWFKFSNQTGSTVYLSNTRLLKCSKLFKVSGASTRSFADASYELNFSDGKGNFNQRQIILNTNDKTETVIAIDNKPELGFFSYEPAVWRKLLHYPKYFRLNYVAMVGTKHYRVSTNY